MSRVRKDPDVAPVEGPDALVWVTQEVLRAIIAKYDEKLVDQDRAPAWVVIAAGAFFATGWMNLTGDLTPPEIFDRVRNDADLKQSLLAAVRLGAPSTDIIMMILEWRKE